MDSIHSPVEHGENHQEEAMKTPHAILIGLSLIVALGGLTIWVVLTRWTEAPAI